MSETNLPEIGFIREADLRKIVPIGATTLWRWVREGKFPKPVKLSERVTAWRAEDVREWLSQQKT